MKIVDMVRDDMERAARTASTPDLLNLIYRIMGTHNAPALWDPDGNHPLRLEIARAELKRRKVKP
jgi:hypothetical protein